MRYGKKAVLCHAPWMLCLVNYDVLSYDMSSCPCHVLNAMSKNIVCRCTCDIVMVSCMWYYYVIYIVMVSCIWYFYVIYTNECICMSVNKEQRHVKKKVSSVILVLFFTAFFNFLIFTRRNDTAVQSIRTIVNQSLLLRTWPRAAALACIDVCMYVCTFVTWYDT